MRLDVFSSTFAFILRIRVLIVALDTLVWRPNWTAGKRFVEQWRCHTSYSSKKIRKSSRKPYDYWLQHFERPRNCLLLWKIICRLLRKTCLSCNNTHENGLLSALRSTQQPRTERCKANWKQTALFPHEIWLRVDAHVSLSCLSFDSHDRQDAHN